MMMELCDLKLREYWTPAECARVLGERPTTWRRRLDRGQINGHKTAGGHRMIRAASARQFKAEQDAAYHAMLDGEALENLHTPIDPPQDVDRALQELYRDFGLA